MGSATTISRCRSASTLGRDGGISPAQPSGVTWLWFLVCVLTVIEICRQIFGPKRAAREIVDDSKALYSTRHEFAEIRAEDFRDLDHQFYNRAEAELEALGFGHVADIEDLTVSRQFPAMRTFIRLLTGDQRSTTASIYHLKFRRFYRCLQLVGLLAQKPFFIDLESEFSDGTFLVTSNTRGIDLSSDVPGVCRQALPQATAIAAVVAAHREAFRQMCQGQRTVTKVSTLAEMRALQDRLQAAKNRHKKSLGYVDAEQLARAAAKFEYDDANHQLALELRVLREQNLAGTARGSNAPVVPAR